MRFERSVTNASLMVVTAAAIGLFAYMLRYPELPPALSSQAALEKFSGERALVHIQHIATEPRPTGSPGLARAREYLIKALKNISSEMRIEAQVEVQESLVVESLALPGIASATRLKNIVARFPGTYSTRPLLLVAHYDSVVNGLGANDDGAGVAVILELARAIVARGPRRNDLVVLFTDAEERGMLGAQAYARDHERGQEPALVFNFEARGNTGLALLFQTGPHSDWLVREFAQNAPAPAATSIAQELFRVLPYGTDFSIFARKGMPGLNFAYINNTVHYHSMLDTPASVDVRSLQHHGENVLELLAGLLNRDLTALPSASITGRAAVYLPIPGGLFVYDGVWDVALLVCVSALYLAIFSGDFRRARLRAIAFQFFAPLFVGMIAAASVAVLWFTIVALHPEYRAILFTGETYQAHWFKAALQCAGVLVAFGIYARWTRKLRGVAAGGFAYWLFCAMLATLFAPGAAYLVLWPLLVYLGLFGVIRLRRGDADLLKSDVLLLHCGLPVVALLFAPVVRFLFFGLLNLTTQPVTMPGYSPWIFLIALSFGGDSMRTPRQFIYCALSLASVILFVVGVHAAAFSADQPRPNSLFYVHDADRTATARFSCDPQLDDWTRRFFSESEKTPTTPPRLGDYLPVLHACLPGLNDPYVKPVDATAALDPANFPPPIAEIADDRRLPNGARQITVRVASRRGAQSLYVFFRSVGGSSVIPVTVDGVIVPARSRPLPVDAESGVWKFVRGMFASAIDLRDWNALVLASSGKSDYLISFTINGDPAPLELRLVDHTRGLPATPEHHRGAAYVAGGRYPFSDGIFVTRQFHF